MTRLPDDFREDRRLRDAARAVVAADIARLRASLGEEGIASRVTGEVGSTITGRIRSGAGDVLAQARALAADHKGVLALLIGAIILWLARGAIRDGLSKPEADPESAAVQADADEESLTPPSPTASGDPS